jgi:outer membrane lipoprotein-sorting protein
MQVMTRSLSGVALLTLFWLATGLAQAAEFTATMVTKAGDKEIPGKIYVKDNKVRNELQVAGMASIHIMRPDKKVVWIIMPQQKAYMEMPFSQEAQQKLLPLTEEQKAKMKKVGAETVNGYACDKYETTMSHQGKAMQVFTWLATDLGMPIKIVSADGSFSIEYQDIKPGEVGDSLFEVPQGYQKMKLPFAMPPSK